MLVQGDGNRQPSARDCAEACKCALPNPLPLRQSQRTPSVASLSAVDQQTCLRPAQVIKSSKINACISSSFDLRRAHVRCNAWFWCKAARQQACFDMQSEAWVAWHGCSLLDIPVLPMAPPDAARPAQTSDPASFRSFAAGYLKREPLIRVLHHKSRCRCIDLPSDRPIQAVVGMQHAGLVQVLLRLSSQLPVARGNWSAGPKPRICYHAPRATCMSGRRKSSWRRRCSFQWGQNPNCCRPALQATCMSGRRTWSSRQRCSSAAMPTGARQSASGRTT